MSYVVTALLALTIVATGVRSAPSTLDDVRAFVNALPQLKASRYHSQFRSLQEFHAHVTTYTLPLPIDHVKEDHSAGCHNGTGACFIASKGYMCLSGQWVRHADRCDGIEDCNDGTDELMCDYPAVHWADHRTDEVEGMGQRRRFREQFAAPTCNGCACSVGGPMEVHASNPYFEMAIGAKMTPEFSDMVPKGKRCNPSMTTTMMIRMYKKTGFCRKAICCIRQSACVRCNSTEVTTSPGKCYEKMDLVDTPTSAPDSPS